MHKIFDEIAYIDTENEIGYCHARDLQKYLEYAGSEDIEKLERRVKSEEKKLADKSGKLPDK